MKLVEYFGNIGWKVHEQAWNLNENQFALTDGVVPLWPFIVVMQGCKNVVSCNP